MSKGKFTKEDVEGVVSEIRDFLKDIELKSKEEFEIDLLKKSWPAANPYYMENQKPSQQNMKVYEVLIKEAETSYAHFQMLSSFIADWVRLKPENMPDILKRWLCNYLDGKIEPPKKSRGKTKDYQRRLWIAVAVFMVIDKGFPKGKNDASAGEDNAFSIVSSAAQQVGWSDIKYTTVRDYFRKMQHLV